MLGAARHPISTADFSSLLLQAQGSGADVVGIANAGGDTSNTLKQAAEFGLGQQAALAGLIISHEHAAPRPEGRAGRQDRDALLLGSNDQSRAFAQRFGEKHPRHNMPNDMQAGMYSGSFNLRSDGAVKSAADGKKLVEAMKAIPTDDPIFGNGTIRVDGRTLHPMYLFRGRPRRNRKGLGTCSTWYAKSRSVRPGGRCRKAIVHS